MSKYRSRKITMDGETFDSIKEFRRYQELKLMEKAGLVYDLQRQVKFKLIPAQREFTDDVTATGKPKKGKLIEHECSYWADFVYRDQYGFRVVEDVKGVRTEVYKIKRKLMLWIHGIRIKEV